MKETISDFYNSFLIRDILGYVVPGGLVLYTLAACVASLRGSASDLPSLISLVPEKWIFYIFLLCLCYATGHSISGLFVHFVRFNRPFSFVSPKLFDGKSQTDWETIWIKHSTDYREASAKVTEQLRSQGERYVSLVHFTCHFSGAILLAATFLIIAGFAGKSVRTEHFWQAGLLLVLFPGIYRHFLVLRSQRFQLEELVIKKTASSIATRP